MRRAWRETRSWTNNEVEYLIENYHKQSVEKTANYLQRTIRSVSRKAESCGIKTKGRIFDPIDNGDGTYSIPMMNRNKTKTYYAIVDAEDLPKVMNVRWFAHTNPTAPTYARHVKHRKSVFMHNIILPPPSDMKIDHKNHNGLDNRKENLRFANNAQNQHNSRPKKTWRGRKTLSQYKGVFIDKKNKKHPWRATLRKKTIGRFVTEIEAAKAYDKAAKETFGEFAYLNFPDEEN